MNAQPRPAERVADNTKPARKGLVPVLPRTPRHRMTAALRETRAAAGLTIAQVEVGSGVYGYSQIERGKNVNLRHAMMLARFFGKPVEELWSLPAAGADHGT